MIFPAKLAAKSPFSICQQRALVYTAISLLPLTSHMPAVKECFR